MVCLLANLRIDKVIVHQIFERSISGDIVQPKYSKDFTDLDAEGLNVLQQRIVNTLGDDSYCVEMSINQNGPGSAYDLCCRLLDASVDNFKILSKDFAFKLAQAQSSRKIPGGVVVIFSGLEGNQNNRFVGVIKAELHGGFNIQDYQGKITLKFLADLLLTPSQKLYKIAMFSELPKTNNSVQRSPDDFKVLIYDHNMTQAETRQAARYFYEAFLGCSFSPSDKKLTRDFYYKTKEYVDDLKMEDEEKLDLHTSLYTYLKTDLSNIVQVSDFASKYIQEPAVKDNYVRFMEKEGLPSNAFSKDLTHIKHSLRRRSLKFNTDVKITAPSDRFKELVNVKGRDNGHTIIDIEGEIVGME